MSKFSPLMHLLDLKNYEIKDREYPNNLKPFYKQQVCYIKLNLPKLNPLCARCRFADVVTTRGKVDELGIGGYMSNQADGLKAVNHNPAIGVKLREPHTIIIAEGQAYRCKNRKVVDIMFLTEEEPSCNSFSAKEETKKKA